MSFLKALFGSWASGGSAEPAMRRLSHPRDIRTGDIIKFRFTDQSEVSGKEFEVSQINTYIYGDMCYPELVLKDRSDTLIYMMVEEEDGEEYLALSRKIPKAQMHEVIPSDDLDRILSAGTGVRISITKPAEFKEWLTSNYVKVDDDIKGAFVKGDVRYLSDEELRRRERFTSYILEDTEGEYALEVEVYDTGETELSVTVYYDVDEIEEMWPGGSAQ